MRTRGFLLARDSAVAPLAVPHRGSRRCGGGSLARLRATLALPTVSCALICAPAVAQESYPSRTIKVVVPYLAGTTADAIPRIVMDKVSARLGQPVIIENRPGATGNLGAEQVARAEPDGYTLLTSAPPPLAINQNLFPNLAFNPAAFEAISLLTVVPNVMVVSGHVPAGNLKDFVALTQHSADGMLYASTGAGGTPHLTMEMLKLETGARLRDVPYNRGTASAIVDLLTNRVNAMVINISEALPHHQSGGLKVLAVTTDKRVAELPNVPTAAETIPGFYSATWYALVAPPKTPQPIVAKLSTVVREALQTPDVAEKLTKQSMIVMGSTPQETQAFIKSEIERWRSVIQRARIKVN